MSSLLFIICLLVGSFTFSTLLYIYFAYNAKPDPEEAFMYHSFSNDSKEALHVSIDKTLEEKVA